MKYKVVVRFLGRADLKDYREGKWVDVEVFVNNPNLTRILAFPAPEEGISDYIAIYEFIPVEEGEK